MSRTDQAPPKTTKHEWRTPDGRLMPLANSRIEKYYRDILIEQYGIQYDEKVEGRKGRIVPYTVFDPGDPFKGFKDFKPGPDNPICKKCKMCELSKTPFQDYEGPEDPYITVVYPEINPSEVKAGGLALDGDMYHFREALSEGCKKYGFTMDDVRWVPLTRCPVYRSANVNVKAKGRWCRHFAVADLINHPPKLIAVHDTKAFGLLNYKSNADLWHMKKTWWRGWPDEWLTKPKFARPQPHYCNDSKEGAGKQMVGHPLFGPIPTRPWIPMIPIRGWRVVIAAANEQVTKKWRAQVKRLGAWAKLDNNVPDYRCDWYRWTYDPKEVRAGLLELLEILKERRIPVCYDTETTGLKPLDRNASIVSIMFRWLDPATKEPRSLGFPWKYGHRPEDVDTGCAQSPIEPYIKKYKLDALVLKVLTRSRLVGHNLTFDILYTHGVFMRDQMPVLNVTANNVEEGKWDERYEHLRPCNRTPEENKAYDRLLCKLADAAQFDTWHMAYTCDQSLKGYSLDVLAHDHATHQAGYEEEMELMISLYEEFLHPKKGGHYLNKPPDVNSAKWDRAIETYVMGDVESTYTAFRDIRQKFPDQETYQIPLARPGVPGKFRLYRPPGRKWVYDRIMSPASRLLMKMMGRGMYVDYQALKDLEDKMPKELTGLRDTVKADMPEIGDWCVKQFMADPTWELDLENPHQLREILFSCFRADIQKFTPEGKKLYGDDPKSWRSYVAAKCKQLGVHKDTVKKYVDKMGEEIINFASVDKFTLNLLAVKHKELRLLQKYKKLFKLYSTYVRPLRNIRSSLDKNDRTKDQHLCLDGCIHASFMLTGTRGGRLSCRDPNLQQLPRDGQVKRMYISRFGKRGFLYQADLSQIELRLMAAACGDPTMIKAYEDEVDLHSLTASRINRVPYEHFTKDYMGSLQAKGKDKEAKELDTQRNIAKTVNFLTGYGGGAFGLQNVLAAKSIYREIEVCENIINLFFDSYPALRSLLSYYKFFIEQNQAAVSIFGRVRPFVDAISGNPEYKSKALRAGCNHLIQSTASDMMLVALMAIEMRMREENLESLLVSTVHDSLLIDGVQEERDIIHEICQEVLDNFEVILPAMLGEDFDTSWMIVPFTGDYEAGKNYLQMRKVPKKDPDWDEVFAAHDE